MVPTPARRRYSSRIVGTVSGREVAPTPAMLRDTNNSSYGTYNASSHRMPIRTPRRGGEPYTPHDPIPPETTPAASIIPTEEVIEVAPVGWLAEREELQEELKRVYGALKALEEHSAEDRKLLARMRDRELNNTMESSRVGQQLEQYIVQLEGEVRALQAIPCSEQPVEEDAHVKEAECGSDYIVGAALILLALVEAISSRVDARLQVYSIEANEKVYRLTTTLKEVREACEELCGQKEAIVKELEEALRDKEENALALADSLATLASSREEFTRFTEQQAKKELVLLDRSADSQSAMSSARSMASQAYDLKWPEGAAVLHLKHQQQQPMAGLEGRLIEGCIREGKEGRL
ncbi:hypothetical protein Pmar_PMAR019741 [Perkinsus marinus ATCC 50983]|uniref:Dynein regulatory complex protein 1/2 N-terminal domain-containing protein n=1 Tax=Perkinsus marinus (strain ATCC 50983 / TXsc) TaxID=423536 RepID=C5LW23_PERM5|nr:hypothetical protein Pmar_PMAR019741 [Perkinsus marinus ATCC 50983]EEQ99093.1 hypothetical protein Pmar_PMAR019741 [Perkinsus marinus ATCC 50983]|eukprot:XP_002766376.1 hypothetical protein Pmar_PMAR019741 [Perkinsus marinus ATCC 50983]